ALLIVPGMKAPASDQSFMLVVQRFYPAWVLGLVAGAGCLAALLPASALLLGAASVLSKNVLGDLFGIATDDRSRTTATRVLVIVVAGMALVFWLFYNKTLVELLLLYYNGVTQFMPGFVCGLFFRCVSAVGVALGIVGGISVSLWLAVSGTLPFGLNAGFFGLFVNVIIVAAFAALRPRDVRDISAI
ncbi:MAG: hypothetical protein M3Y18_09905, partial [Candidatus Eremiobacteraeota bacterium]|nr:hypothetical protein [Candidatus Eremiobacteraeota bacterium]